MRKQAGPLLLAKLSLNGICATSKLGLLEAAIQASLSDFALTRTDQMHAPTRTGHVLAIEQKGMCRVCAALSSDNSLSEIPIP